MDTSFVASGDESPTIYKIRFMPSELTNLYNEVLPNVTTGQVQDYLCKYVTTSIEPIGWRAIWRTVPNNDPNSLSIQYDFEVEVMDVLHNRLEAIAVILKLIHPKESELTAEQFDEKEGLLKTIKIANIPLTQLYVISDVDVDVDDQFHRTAVIIEQIRFFYNNLWRPWDELAGNEGATEEVFVKTKLKPRLELAFDIKDQIIPQSTVNRIKNLLSEAWDIKRKIDSIDSNKWSESLDISVEDNSDIDYISETDLVHAMRLKFRLEDIEREMKLLEDKHLRLIAPSLKTTDTNGLDRDLKDRQNKIHLIAKTFTLKTSKDLLNSLSNISTESETPVMFHNSLVQALSCVQSGDKIYVMPGLYSCPVLPWIENDIEINGFGGSADDVVIEPKDSVGDIFLNCNSNKVVFSGLTIRATSELQCLLMIHSGFVGFTDCVLNGKDYTRNALIVLSKAKVEIEKCKVINERGNGIISRKGSVVINRDEITAQVVDKTDQNINQFNI